MATLLLHASKVLFYCSEVSRLSLISSLKKLIEIYLTFKISYNKNNDINIIVGQWK